MTDPIVDEVRRARDAHAARFGYDLDAIFRDIKEQERQSGLRFVAAVARQPPKDQKRRMAGFAEVLIEFLPTEEGGRRTPICLSTDSPAHYRPHLRVRDGDGQMLGVEFVDGPDDPIPPGGSTFATVRFVYEPNVCYDALVVGAEFDVLEGPRVVGVGRITRR